MAAIRRSISSITVKPVAAQAELDRQKNALAVCSEKLADKKRELQRAIESPRETEEEQINAEARALVSGVAVADKIDLSAIQRRVNVLTRVVEMQRADVEKARQAVAREVTEQLIPQHSAAARRFIELQKEALEAYAAIAQIRATACVASEGDCYLPTLAVNAQAMQRYSHCFSEFAHAVSSYIQ